MDFSKFEIDDLALLVQSFPQKRTQSTSSRLSFLYASAPLDLGAYVRIGSPKLGASESFTVLGITVLNTLDPKYFFTSSATCSDRFVLPSNIVRRIPRI